MKKVPRKTMAGAFPATRPMKPGTPTFKSTPGEKTKALRRRSK